MHGKHLYYRHPYAIKNLGGFWCLEPILYGIRGLAEQTSIFDGEDGEGGGERGGVRHKTVCAGSLYVYDTGSWQYVCLVSTDKVQTDHH